MPAPPYSCGTEIPSSPRPAIPPSTRSRSNRCCRSASLMCGAISRAAHSRTVPLQQLLFVGEVEADHKEPEIVSRDAVLRLQEPHASPPPSPRPSLPRRTRTRYDAPRARRCRAPHRSGPRRLRRLRRFPGDPCCRTARTARPAPPRHNAKRPSKSGAGRRGRSMDGRRPVARTAGDRCS